MRSGITGFIFFILLFSCFTLAPAGIIGDRLQSVLSTSSASDTIYAWVYFADKGSGPLSKLATPEALVSELSLIRRRNVLPEGLLVDVTDLPVQEDYAATVESRVLRLRQRSKWFNAVSVAATPGQIVRLAELPYVSSIELLARFRRRPANEGTESIESPGGQHFSKTDGALRLPYGISFRQLHQVGVPQVHDAGNYGQGVIVGVFDNGVRLPEHKAFESLTIIATRDFVDKKTSVKPLAPGGEFGGHGVVTLSTIAGNAPGTLFGPAFGASYILGRTENDSSETPFEEDNWVAAIEWADSLGVQVTSTSLTYLDYNQPYTSWTWADMNGRTTVISRAAAMAVRKGIVVVNSAGNDNFNATHNTLEAPADADSVLTVGAVTASGARASFSSVGPTTSNPPRIKPDVMAPGVDVVCASASDPNGYTAANGTSLACPLAAGVAALLVKAHPDASPMQIVGALKATASNAGSPNRLTGWGTINAYLALRYMEKVENPPATAAVMAAYPNPFKESTSIEFNLTEGSQIRMEVYDVLGRRVRRLFDGPQEIPGLPVTWDGMNEQGYPVATGVYLCRVTITAASGQTTDATIRILCLR